MKRHWSSILRALAALAAVVLLAGAALPVGAGSAAAQEPAKLWQQPRISIVWPHDGQGHPTSVEQSRMVNVSVWPSNQVACCQNPGFRLLVAKDNEPAQIVYQEGQVIERPAGGVTFPSLEFNNIPADLADNPSASYRFVVLGEDTNVWVHAADPRTIFPQQVVPTGYSEPRPLQVDARIQVVWPHDVQGRLCPVAEAPLVNIAVDLFAHSTLNSVPLDYEPHVLGLRIAQGNGPLTLQPGLLPQKITYTANGQAFPRWVFNNVPVEPGQPYHFAPYVYEDLATDLPSWSCTIWTHAANARTLLPNPRPPRPAVSSWQTYEDAAQRYRLRYPAGATIATDQSGQTTFTLTDNQTTYTVRLGKREALVGSDGRVARPAVLLATISQNPGLFDMSEIQEFTINGTQAARVAYSYSDPKQEPCRTQRSQAVHLVAGKQLYMLTFQVAGPGQCDATAVPWFEQVLQSFEPY
ncbi:MAG TPA: hypothetical protein PLG21_12225 [Anaerolineae bacterium]|nr:hypothetical protein [Anaerolineae bacterium]